MGTLGTYLGNRHRLFTRFRPYIWVSGLMPFMVSKELILLLNSSVCPWSDPFSLSSKPPIVSSKPLQHSHSSSFIWRILFAILLTFLMKNSLHSSPDLSKQITLLHISERKLQWSAMNFFVSTSLTSKRSLHILTPFPPPYLIHRNLTVSAIPQISISVVTSIELVHSTLETQSLNQWTTREIPGLSSISQCSLLTNVDRYFDSNHQWSWAFKKLVPDAKNIISCSLCLVYLYADFTSHFLKEVFPPLRLA